MVSAPAQAVRIWGTILIGLFLVFGGISIANAQEEAPNVEAVLFETESETGDGTSTDLTPELLDFSLGHVDDTPEFEQPRFLSIDSLGVEEIHDISVQLGVFGFLFLFLLMFIAFLVKSPYGKKFVFTSMVCVIVLPSIFFIASTIYINVISDTGGPVHWHTDFKIYACGEELPPPEAKGKLSNKTGTPVLHQHVDERVHVEGVLIDTLDASFQRFVEVQGGELTKKTFNVPTGTGFRQFTNGDACPDGKPGEWNVFMYRTDVDDNTVSKTKLVDYINYVPAPHIEVPPGDCLIFEFGPRQADTERICNFYQIEINKGNLTPTWTQ